MFEKVEIYFQARKNNKNTYLNKDEYEIAKKNFNSIIEKKNISKKKLESLKKELSKSNSIIFTFLREDLKVFNEKNIKDIINTFFKNKLIKYLSNFLIIFLFLQLNFYK